jgi:hypothetical protein
MSAFNEANELASQLVYGRHYQDREAPCEKLTQLVFTRKEQEIIVAPPEATHDAWMNAANRIERLLRSGNWYISINDEDERTK